MYSDSFFRLVRVSPDGDCFFHCVERAIGLTPREARRLIRTDLAVSREEFVGFTVHPLPPESPYWSPADKDASTVTPAEWHSRSERFLHPEDRSRALRHHGLVWANHVEISILVDANPSLEIRIYTSRPGGGYLLEDHNILGHAGDQGIILHVLYRSAPEYHYDLLEPAAPSLTPPGGPIAVDSSADSLPPGQGATLPIVKGGAPSLAAEFDNLLLSEMLEPSLVKLRQRHPSIQSEIDGRLDMLRPPPRRPSLRALGGIGGAVRSDQSLPLLAEVPLALSAEPSPGGQGLSFSSCPSDSAHALLGTSGAPALYSATSTLSVGLESFHRGACQRDPRDPSLSQKRILLL
jgi:hypothetical protein